MQLSSPTRRRAPKTILSLLMLLPGISTAAKLECDKIATDGFTFNLDALKGPHTVITSVHHGTRFTNVTYSLDLCGPLKRKDDVKKEDACPEGSWGKLVLSTTDVVVSGRHKEAGREESMRNAT